MLVNTKNRLHFHMHRITHNIVLYVAIVTNSDDFDLVAFIFEHIFLRIILSSSPTECLKNQFIN